MHYSLEKRVHPVNGEVPPVKGRPRKLPHYANRGKTSSSGGELASTRSCFSTVRTALGKLRITGLLAQFDVARSFPQFPRPLLLQPTILTSERGTRFGIRKPPNHVPPPHLPDDPKNALVVFHCVLDQVGDHLSVQPSFGEKKQQRGITSPSLLSPCKVKLVAHATACPRSPFWLICKEAL